MQEKFLESIGATGVDFSKYHVKHLIRILHLSMFVRNTCFWINDAFVSYRTLETADQAKILKDYIQHIVNFQYKETCQ
jgi:hypothetical protein